MREPIYIVIAEDLKKMINSGELEPGDSICSENMLSEQYNVSRMTVRKSLTLLSSEGYIYSIPGKGNYVSVPDQDKYILYFNEMKSIEGSVDETKLLDVNVIKPTMETMYNMKAFENKRLILVRRLMYIDTKPVAYDLKYIPYYRGMPVVEKEINYATFPELVAQKKSLFAIRKELKIKAQRASKDVVDNLRINDGDPIMAIEQKLLDDEDKIVGWGTTYFLSDYFQLQAISSL